MTEQKTEQTKKRPRYKACCPKCNREVWATKSIFQEHFNMPEHGFGSCPHCQTNMQLIWQPNSQDFKTELWDVYISIITKNKNKPHADTLQEFKNFESALNPNQKLTINQIIER